VSELLSCYKDKLIATFYWIIRDQSRNFKRLQQKIIPHRTIRNKIPHEKNCNRSFSGHVFCHCSK